MKIRIIGHDRSYDAGFTVAGPWNSVAQLLERNGHQIVREKYPKKIDFLIANQHSLPAIEEAKSNKIPLSNRALIYWEPQVTESLKFKHKVFSQYGIHAAPSSHWLNENQNNIIFNWPQTKFIDIKESFLDWNTRINQAVIIQGNKFSAVKGEAYSLRRNILVKDENEKNLISLYGTNWNSGYKYDFRKWIASTLRTNPLQISFNSISHAGHTYQNYNGKVKDKFETARNYKIALVIENSLDYVSEKLFDAINSGCITVYVGPNLVEKGLIDPSIIQLDPSVQTIYQKIKDLIELDPYTQYEISRKQRLYFNSKMNDWYSETVLTRMFEKIVGKKNKYGN